MGHGDMWADTDQIEALNTQFLNNPWERKLHLLPLPDPREQASPSIKTLNNFTNNKALQMFLLVTHTSPLASRPTEIFRSQHSLDIKVKTQLEHRILPIYIARSLGNVNGNYLHKCKTIEDKIQD